MVYRSLDQTLRYQSISKGVGACEVTQTIGRKTRGDGDSLEAFLHQCMGETLFNESGRPGIQSWIRLENVSQYRDRIRPEDCIGANRVMPNDLQSER
jgi:hypothetical protein